MKYTDPGAVTVKILQGFSINGHGEFPISVSRQGNIPRKDRLEMKNILITVRNSKSIAAYIYLLIVQYNSYRFPGMITKREIHPADHFATVRTKVTQEPIFIQHRKFTDGDDALHSFIV